MSATDQYTKDARSIGLRLSRSDAIPQLWAWMRVEYMVANWLTDQGTVLVFDPTGRKPKVFDGIKTYDAAFAIVRTRGIGSPRKDGL